jgi:PIN domain nuclease of toxin-antitoxin system
MLTEPHRLSKEQVRLIYRAAECRERRFVSAVTLVEIATVFGRGSRRLEIAREVAVMGDSLKDPNDRVIVATARIHGLRLVTSDQRIIDSGLVPVVE